MKSNETLILGGGCFWCTEAFYKKLDGVVKVVSGYAGGRTENPTYEEICQGNTGHAEVVSITYDSEKISLKQLVDYFWMIHDPTTLNRQGHDVGTQYRSIIFYSNEVEKQVISQSIMEAQEFFSDPIQTQVEPGTVFYPAEPYHQDFYEQNPRYGYCQVVIDPKMKKLGLKGQKNLSVNEVLKKTLS